MKRNCTDFFFFLKISFAFVCCTDFQALVLGSFRCKAHQCLNFLPRKPETIHFMYLVHYNSIAVTKQTKNVKGLAGKLAQRLRALVALSEDQALIPSTCTASQDLL